MENAKKMLLVEPELLDRLKQEKTVSTDPLTQLDNEMQNVLNMKKDDREKWILYLQTLQRYLHFTAKERQPIHVPIISDSFKDTVNEDDNNKHKDQQNFIKEPVSNLTSQVEDVRKNNILPASYMFYSPTHILKTIPKSYIKKGELLMEHLINKKDKIHWDDKGTVFIENVPIVGSNITDLVTDVLRSTKQSEPIGWERFLLALKNIKVPVSYISNPKRFEYLKQLYVDEFMGSVTPKNYDIIKKDVTPKNSNTTQKDDDSLTPKNTEKKSKIKNKIDWQRWTPY